MIKASAFRRGFLVAVASLAIPTMSMAADTMLTPNVGIGTSAPQALLHVSPATGGAEERLESTAGNDSSRSFYRNGALLGRIWFPGANVAGNRYFGFQNVLGDYLRFDAAAKPMFFITNNVSRVTITTDGKIGIGTTDPTSTLTVTGDVSVSGNIAAKYQDVAEWVPARQQLSAGTVVVLDPTATNQVVSSTQAYDTAVAGVISVNPGLILGEAGKNKVMVATAGRLKVKTDATRRAIRVGDLLVTSNIEGLAMASEPIELSGVGVKVHRPGTIVGKALEPLEGGQGEILVLLSLQ